jgi:hypothetical protein
LTLAVGYLSSCLFAITSWLRNWCCKPIDAEARTMPDPLLVNLQWGLFAISIIIGIVSAMIVKEKLNILMGLPNWDFSTSWATNITVFGGAVSIPTIISALASPADVAGYLGMNMVFLVLAAAAPTVYNFSREVSLKSTPSGDSEIVSQGRAYMFLVAAAITTWASTGQVYVVVLLVDELRRKDFIAGSIARLVELVLAFVILGLFRYSQKTMVDTILVQPTPGPGVAAAETSRPPPWTLL